MERGEVQGMIGDDWASIKANKAEWLREKKIRILMQMTASRHADLPDVPVAGEFAKDEEKRRVLELFVLRQKYGRPFWRRRGRRCRSSPPITRLSTRWSTIRISCARRRGRSSSSR